MKKLLLSISMTLSFLGLYAQNTDIYIATWSAPGVGLPNSAVWGNFYNNGNLVRAITGVTDSTNSAVYHSSLSGTFTFDSLVCYSYDCNGNIVFGVQGSILPNTFNFYEDTIYMSCALSTTGCQASYIAQQSTSQALTINFTDNSTKSPIPNRATWRYIFFGDNDSSLVPDNFSHTYPASGTYYIEYRYGELDSISGNYNFCESRFYDTITVSASTAITCNANYSVDTVNSGSGTAIIYNNSTPAQNNPAYINTYFWDFGDGSTSNQPFPTHNYVNSGMYQVCLSITADSSGSICSSTFCDSLGIDSLGNLLYKSAGAGFTLQVLDPVVGIDESPMSELMVYPNPVKNVIKVETGNSNLHQLNWVITDLKGAALKNGDFKVEGSESELSIDVINLKPGVYMLQLSNEEGQTSQYKVVKD